MRFIKSLVAVGCLALLAACSTQVDTRLVLDKDTAHGLRFESVEAKSSLPDLPPDAASRLENTVRKRLAALPQGARDVKVAIVITHFDVVGAGMRALTGAMSGPSKATISVKVVDAAGTTVADFDVTRSSNPGGYGMFYDQQWAMFNSLADAIADVVQGRSSG